MEKKVGFIGIGNMAGAIASSLLREHEDIASQVYIANRNVEKAEKFAQEHGANSCRTNREVVEVSDIIFLGATLDFTSKLSSLLSKFINFIISVLLFVVNK